MENWEINAIAKKDNIEGKTSLNGLTKREYFAGQVLTGLMVQAIPGAHNSNQEMYNKERAKFCVDMADELLKQLDK